ncbi:MAG: sigma-70 family RNA polymerase sigma factor [Planctomycetota bacterium]
MLLVRQGDEAAFVDLIGRYQKKMLNFFYRLSWDFHASEDLTQEVFLRIYRYRGHYEETAQFQTFIYRIARNLWIDQVRKRRVRPDTVSLDQEVGGRGDPAVLGDMLADERAEQPSDRADRVDIADGIRAAVAGLDEQDRMLFAMVTRREMKYRDIGEVLGIPEGTVKSKVFYLYRKLRERLEGMRPDEV